MCSSDGKVTAAELREAFRALNYSIDREHVDTFFSFLDADSSGRIDYNELRHALRKGATQLRKFPSGVDGTTAGSGGSTPTRSMGGAGAALATAAAPQPRPSVPQGGGAGFSIGNVLGSAAAVESPLGEGRQLAEWAKMLEATSHVAAFEDRLTHAEHARKHAEAKVAVLEADIRRLTGESVDLRKSVEKMGNDRAAGIAHITSLARAVAVAEQKVVERDRHLAMLQDELSQSSSGELKTLREENQVLISQIELLSARLHSVPHSSGDVNRPSANIHAAQASPPSASSRTASRAPLASTSKSPFVLARTKMPTTPGHPSSERRDHAERIERAEARTNIFPKGRLSGDSIAWR